jgi:hypothetical protein
MNSNSNIHVDFLNSDSNIHSLRGVLDTTLYDKV